MKTSNVQTDSLASVRRAAMAAPMLDAVTERQLLEAYRRNGSSTALARLVGAHMRLVFSIARRFARHGVAMEDLVSEGSLGLVQAASRFDLERQTRFAVYAAWWIRAFVRRYSLENRRIVGLPSTRSARKILAQLRQTERALEQEHGGPAPREAVAKALDVSTDDLHMMVGALGARDVPLDPSAYETGYQAVSPDSSPEECMAQAEVAMRNEHAIRHALDSLPVRERMIVEQRILASESATLADLGATLGLSRERVRQLEVRACATLRDALASQVA